MAVGKENKMKNNKTLTEILNEINPDQAEALIKEAKMFAFSLEKRICPFVEGVEGGTLSYTIVIEKSAIKDTIAYVERLSKRIVWKAVELRNLGLLSNIMSFPEGWLKIADILDCLGFYEAADIVEDDLLPRLKAIEDSTQKRTRAARA